MDAVRRLTDMGIRCGVLVAPVLPGLSDREDQLRQVVEACAAAGAVSVTGVALHLRGPMRSHYLDWLEAQRPDLVGVHRCDSAAARTSPTKNESVSRASCGRRRCAAA